MKDCIFCKIANKEILAEIIWENNDFLAFLDIDPNTKGHTLVVPKKHFRWTYDIPNFGEYFEVAKKIALACITGLQAEWVSFMTVGVHISHAHIHVLPRYKNDLHQAVVNTEVHEKFTKEQLIEIAEKIRTAVQ